MPISLNSNEIHCLGDCMFQGSIPALIITLFKNGAIDGNALHGLVKWYIEQGSHIIVITLKICSQLRKANLQNDFVTTHEVQDKILSLHRAIFSEPGVCGAKAGLRILGFCFDKVRLPLVTVSRNIRKSIESAMQSTGLHFDEFRLVWGG